MKSPRRKPSQRRSKTLVDAVIQAGTELIHRASDGSVSIGRIAERAGVSIGSVYQYFSSKEQVVGEIGNRRAMEHLHAFEKRLAGLKEFAPREQLEKTVDAVCDLYFEQPTLLRNLFALGPEWRKIPAVQEARDQASRRLANYLKTLPQGTLRRDNPELAIFVLVNSVLGTLQTAVARELTDRTALRAELIDLCHRYLFT